MPERARRLEAMFDLQVFQDGTQVLRTFWCNGCQFWTKHEPWTESDLELIMQGDTVSPTCGRCGEAYGCGECGYEIDQQGNCLREEGHDA
ncbi:MAG: hypothetical protein K0Q89_35 [Thermomicrobiales bacterium]|jgi:hypothetical protein|nr:hypothetical protein [Thermomicrobiales bacterium]